MITKYQLIACILALLISSCNNELTKSELKTKTNPRAESDLGLAKYLWIDCDSVRERLRMPVLGNNFYSLKKDHYRMWYNPDTVTTPRLVSIIHLIEYIPVGTLKFNHEIGEIQLNDSISLDYGYNRESSSFGLTKTDLKTKTGKRSSIELSRQEFDSIINAYGAKAILNY